MARQSLDVLARDFSADGARWKPGAGGLPFLAIDTSLRRGHLTTHGGQVCEWTPAGQEAPALFLSPRSAFAEGKAIRGGIPICFPWFGAHPSDPSRPAHGFARTLMWTVVGVSRDGAGAVRVVQRLVSDAHTRALWAAEFAATWTVSLGAPLAMAFEVENTGGEDREYEIALHTYLAVGGVERIRVEGLERTRFVDKVDGAREKVSSGDPVALVGETDRVFVGTTASCTVDDPVLGRRVRIEKSAAPPLSRRSVR